MLKETQQRGGSLCTAALRPPLVRKLLTEARQMSNSTPIPSSTLDNASDCPPSAKDAALHLSVCSPHDEAACAADRPPSTGGGERRIRVGLSEAFLNKDLQNGYTKAALGNSFIQRDVTLQ